MHVIACNYKQLHALHAITYDYMQLHVFGIQQILVPCICLENLVTSTSNFIRNRQRLFNELNHILFQVTTGNHNAPGRRPGRRARLGSARTGLGLQVRADPTAVQCTCSGCDLSFNSKRAIDAHRTSKYVSPLCRKGFLGHGGQRLRLVVTARDFRVSGRHPRDRADDEGDYMMYT